MTSCTPLNFDILHYVTSLLSPADTLPVALASRELCLVARHRLYTTIEWDLTTSNAGKASQERRRLERLRLLCRTLTSDPSDSFSARSSKSKSSRSPKLSTLVRHVKVHSPSPTSPDTLASLHNLLSSTCEHLVNLTKLTIISSSLTSVPVIENLLSVISHTAENLGTVVRDVIIPAYHNANDIADPNGAVEGPAPLGGGAAQVAQLPAEEYHLTPTSPLPSSFRDLRRDVRYSNTLRLSMDLSYVPTLHLHIPMLYSHGVANRLKSLTLTVGARSFTAPPTMALLTTERQGSRLDFTELTYPNLESVTIVIRSGVRPFPTSSDSITSSMSDAPGWSIWSFLIRHHQRWSLKSAAVEVVNPGGMTWPTGESWIGEWLAECARIMDTTVMPRNSNDLRAPEHPLNLDLKIDMSRRSALKGCLAFVRSLRGKSGSTPATQGGLALRKLELKTYLLNPHELRELVDVLAPSGLVSGVMGRATFYSSNDTFKLRGGIQELTIHVGRLSPTMLNMLAKDASSAVEGKSGGLAGLKKLRIVQQEGFLQKDFLSHVDREALARWTSLEEFDLVCGESPKYHSWMNSGKGWNEIVSGVKGCIGIGGHE